MIFVWIAVFIVLIIFEAATTALVSIWFIFGALAAFVTALFTKSILIQLIVFSVVSLVALLLTRSIVKDKMKMKPVPTNADRVIGLTGEVIEAITPDTGGRIFVDNISWAAKSTVPIEKGTYCTVVAIEGVTLVVSPAK